MYLDRPDDGWIEALRVDGNKGEKFYKILGTIMTYDFLLCSKIKEKRKHEIIFASKIKKNKVKWVLAVVYFFKVGKMFESKGWEPKHEVDKMLSEIESQPNVKPWKEIDAIKPGTFEFSYQEGRP